MKHCNAAVVPDSSFFTFHPNSYRRSAGNYYWLIPAECADNAE